MLKKSKDKTKNRNS